MTERIAAFVLGDDGIYLPANKNAIAVTAIISRFRLRIGDMAAVRKHGFTPRLLNGQEIGRVDERA